MTLSIYHVTLRHHGTPLTLLQCVLVPNWFEKRFLGRTRVKINYYGHKQSWSIYRGKVLTNSEGKRLEKHEQYFIALGKKNNIRILKFK